MNISLGNRYLNKTHYYLTPILKTYPKIFVKRLEKVFKLGIGINDYLKPRQELAFYILCDSSVQEKFFFNFLGWLRNQDYYLDDYACDEDVKRSCKYMIVIKFPEEYYTSLDMFIKSKYSEMYTKEQIQELFNSKSLKPQRDTLLKNSTAFTRFVKRTNQIFNTNLTKSDYDRDKIEFDYPISLEEETFNYDYRNIG